MKRISRVLIGVSDAAYERLERQLEMYYSISSNTASQEQILDGIPRFKAEAVIIGTGLQGAMTQEDFYRSLKATHPDLKVMIYAEETDHLISEQLAGRVAIEEPSFMTAPVTNRTEETSSAADEQEVGQEQDWNNANLSKPTHAARLSPSEMMPDDEDWQRSVEATVDIHGFHRKLVVVTGASGGIGKTDLSINLAVRLSEQGFKTVLCGFNLQNDDVARRLGLTYKRGKKLMTAFELHASGRLNAGALQDVMQQYRGLDVLVGIERPVESQDMTESFFQDISRMLKSNYDVVVVDTENNSFSPAFYSLIRIADHVLCPCTSHNSVAEQLRDELGRWKEAQDIPLSKVDILFNKCNEGGFITKETIEKYTTREVIAQIPYSKLILCGSEREEPGVLRNGGDGRKIRREMDKVVFRVTGLNRKGEDSIKPRFLSLKKKVAAVASK
ncbi:AAA family ATPase [Paenibacillus pasadenensis]|uniref:AAA family ATPase n=1 Tax=Paenibacillus pasadenensis TaxID=217090 RepID=UPI00041D39AF|nr:AAA family ATPase [Paenibacillus pasadenensis]